MACPWIHCNICLRLPSANLRYFISNCGHIACSSCVEKKLLAPKCYICKRDAKIEEINKDLREDLKKYFVNIADFAYKSFNEVKAVIEFQSKNTRRLLKYKMEKIQELQNTTMKHSEDAATIAKLQKQVEELQMRNRDLETENQNLSSSFINQQTLVNQLRSNNATTTMNVTPSFLQGSLNGNNLTQHDLFNLVNASYLNSSHAPRRHDEASLHESVVSPNQIALDQSSLNFGQSSFTGMPRRNLMEQILAHSSQRLDPHDRSTSVTPSQPLRRTQQQISESLRTPSNAPTREPRQMSSARPSQRLPDAIATKNRCQTDKLNYSTRSWGGFRSESSVLSTRTTRSAPSKSTLYKAPVVTPSCSTSNVRTPQALPPLSQSRSRTVCPHWPRSRCHCNKD